MLGGGVRLGERAGFFARAFGAAGLDFARVRVGFARRAATALAKAFLRALISLRTDLAAFLACLDAFFASLRLVFAV